MHHNPLGLLKKRTSFLEDQRKECLIFFYSVSKQGTKVYREQKYIHINIYIFFFLGGGGGVGGGGGRRRRGQRQSFEGHKNKLV